MVAEGRGHKKPTTVSSRGFLLKVSLRTTRPRGIAAYHGYDHQLEHYGNARHVHGLSRSRGGSGQAWTRPPEAQGHLRLADQGEVIWFPSSLVLAVPLIVPSPPTDAVIS